MIVRPQDVTNATPAYVRAGDRLPASTVNAIIDATQPGSMRLRSMTSPEYVLPWNMMPFGWIGSDTANGTVTLANGIVLVQPTNYTWSSAAVTLSDGDNYVYAAISPHAASPSVAVSVSSSFPISTASEAREPLYFFKKDSTTGVITLEGIYNIGVVKFVGWRP